MKIHDNKDNIIRVYSDASHDDFGSGMGFLIRGQGIITLESISVNETTDTNDGESSAAAHALIQTIRLASVNTHIILTTDYLTLYDYANGNTSKSKHLHIYNDMFDPILDFADTKNITITVNHIKGHGGGNNENYDTDDAWLNGIAHCLAGMGRAKQPISKTILDSQNFKEDIQKVHWKLNPIEDAERKDSYSIQETAYELGINKKYVETLVLKGHIPFDAETLRIPTYTVRNLKKKLEEISNQKEELIIKP